MSGIRTAIELDDRFTSVMYGIINSMNLAISSIQDVQSTMSADVDTTSLNSAREAMNQVGATWSELHNTLSNNTTTPTTPASPVETPVSWQSDTLEVFSSSGMERFQQEVQSTNDMLNSLNQTQTQIQQTASTMDVLPDTAVQDINAIGQRIEAIQTRIEQIENNPMNIGTDTANTELEQLRFQLSQAVEEQNALNDAIQNMDVSAANNAYMRLSQTVSNTERYIRDNADEQGQFNQQIQEGTNQADNLMQTIKGAVAAYVSIQSIGKVLDISDELVQTTSRLNLMNDGAQTTDELFNMVYASAQDARGSVSDMASVVARFGNNAKDAFGSSAEVVAFSNLVQKQMTIAGASTQESSNAMLQLSQALGSGVLRGDELNSIFEQAPNLIQNIADYLGVGIGEIRELASEGELTANIVKNAIFAAGDEINAKFESMPMTWAQIWQSMKNTALINFQPVLNKLNELANSDNFQKFVNVVTNLMAKVAVAFLNAFDLMASAGSFVADNWSVIEPIILGIVTALALYAAYLGITKTMELASAAAKTIVVMAEYAHAAATRKTVSSLTAETAAQLGLNTALLSCPLFWIVSLMLILVVLIAVFTNKLAKSAGISTSSFGIICGMINVVIQWFKNLGLWVANVALGIGMALNACGYNMKTAFTNSILNVESLFYDFVSIALTCVEKIAKQLSKLPFVKFDYEGIGNAADEYAEKAAELQGQKGDYKNIISEFKYGMDTFSTFDDGWISDAFDSGEEWGNKIAEKVSNLKLSIDSDFNYNLDDYMDETTGYLDDISDSLEITEEDLKYLRDIAEQETVNRFTTAEIKIEQTNHNTVSSNMDLDGVVSGITDAVNEAVEIITEGVHT